MAAPGSKEGTFCERCFASVGKGEAYCPECGAPTGEASPAADSAVHGELAQANLLRLRGDLDGSEKALLAVLRRFPNDPHAHEMLGDVCDDRGEPERAVEWYELALDLAPNSPDARRKLADLRERLDARTTADTAVQIGLPPARPVAAWWPLAASGAILLLAVAVAAWPRSAPAAVRRETVVAPAPEAPVATAPDPRPSAVPPTTAPPPTVLTAQDGRLLADLQKGTEGSRILSVVTDPRGAVDVTFEIAETDDPKALALTLGKAALEAAPAAGQVTLRAMRAGTLVFAADLARTDAETLTNVWPATDPTAPTEPATGTAPIGTGTSAGSASGAETSSGPPPTTTHTGP